VRTSLVLIALLLVGCASIPPEAPELSAELGRRLGAIEASHRALLHAWIDEKEARVEDFLQDRWIPRFARNYFSQPHASALWEQVATEGDAEDRMRYLLTVAPELLAEIDRQRRSMLAPLYALERTVEGRVAAEYDQARAINHTLTTYLVSASEVDEVRRRYLERFGVGDEELAGLLEEADAAVTTLVEKRAEAQEVLREAEDFIARMHELEERARRLLGGEEGERP
jgi:hypothetical protein